jgi:hypothetical protein
LRRIKMVGREKEGNEDLEGYFGGEEDAEEKKEN